jgi:hypothetical protein
LKSSSFPSFSSLAENVHTTVLRAFPIIHNPCLCLLHSKLSYPSINLLATCCHLTKWSIKTAKLWWDWLGEIYLIVNWKLHGSKSFGRKWTIKLLQPQPWDGV